MTIRLALATSAAFPDLNPDDHAVRDLLRQRHGLDARAAIWNDPGVDWAAFDAVLIRSIWDYFQHYAAYLAWLDRLQALGVATLNPLPVLRWNSDKRYLLELQQAGIEIAPSRLLRGAALPAALAAEAAGSELIVKPTVSGGAWHTVRGTVGDPAFAAALAALPADLEFLLQPYLPEIAAAGEWSLLYYGGGYSHAVLKRPASGDFRVQSQFGGSTECLPPPPAVRAGAEATLAAVAAAGQPALDYVRIDGVEVGGRFVLMEVEAIEPYLFLGMHPDASARLAQAVATRLRAPAGIVAVPA